MSALTPNVEMGSIDYIRTGSPGLMLAIIIVLLLIIIFNEDIILLVFNIKQAFLGAAGLSRLRCGCRGRCRGKCGRVENSLPDEDDFKRTERLDPHDASMPPTTNIDPTVLTALGYTDGASWMESMSESELDPSVFSNHGHFVADVRRFDSGANFTSVADDNNSFAFVNFQGLRRPRHVDIYQDARSIPDIDQDVLQRNHSFSI